MAARPVEQVGRDRAAAQDEGAQPGRFGQARVAQAAQLGGHERGQRDALQRRRDPRVRPGRRWRRPVRSAPGWPGRRRGTAAARTASGPRAPYPNTAGEAAAAASWLRHGQLHGLGLAGGARREQHRVHGVRVQQQARLQIGLEAVLERPVEHELRARQLDLAAPALGRQPGVQGHQRGAQPRRGVQQGGELGPGRQRRGHAVTLPHAQRRQPPRGQGGRRVQLRVGQRCRQPTPRPDGRAARAPRGHPIVQANYRTAGRWPTTLDRAAGSAHDRPRRRLAGRGRVRRHPLRDRRTASPRSRSTGPRCATPSGRRRSSRSPTRWSGRARTPRSA